MSTELVNELRTLGVYSPVAREGAQRIETLTRQRDDLLAMLEAGVGDLGSGGRVTWRERARGVIASIKGHNKE